MSGVHDTRRYEVRHVTSYCYSQPVTRCYGRGCLRPRPTPTQLVLAHELTVEPEPAVVREHVDAFGNLVHYVEVLTPHTRYAVSKHSLIEVAWPDPDLASLDAWTVTGAAAAIAGEGTDTPEMAGGGMDPVERALYRLPSPMVPLLPQVRAWAAGVLRGDAPLGESLTRLTHTIFTDFVYAKGATSVSSTLAELLHHRQGVCQDFAHLAVAACRSVGLPARYVSGYLETQPPPGLPKLEGSDATHAWLSVYVPDGPEGRWVDLDPTNDQPADSRYLVTAWGRDYSDVSPLKGVVFSDGGESSLSVAVDVRRVDGSMDALS